MDPTHATHSQSHGHAHHKPDNSELMASAKVVAEAARHTFSHETNKIDRARVAGAASDILDAACHYGKLEEKSYGKYVEKAEGYLHQYGSSNSSSAAAARRPPRPARGSPCRLRRPPRPARGSTCRRGAAPPLVGPFRGRGAVRERRGVRGLHEDGPGVPRLRRPGAFRERRGLRGLHENGSGLSQEVA
ncbi:uncharacterized protein LOC104433408 [Eucalyptus grandis]|uniref:uncharacterized protein LOC104433408 n=1 Tax=Eucalyptus grandis TaxID=71139 RepID=UPI00192EADB7|nr:uncharacterized protein LOC104433408 [Eucalyptus grandis]